MKKILFTFLSVHFFITGFSQSFEWVTSEYTGIQINPAMVKYDIAVSGEDLIYWCGPSDLHYSYGTDIVADQFVKKLNNEGILLDETVIDGEAILVAIDTDDDGNIYFMGVATDTLDFGGQAMLPVSGDQNVSFVARFNSSLDVDFVMDLNETFGDIYSAHAIKALDNDEFILSYEFAFDTYIVKFNQDLEIIMTLEQVDVPYVSSVDVDASGNIFVTGGCTGPEPSFNGTVYTNSFTYNEYVAKYNDEGATQWVNFNEDITCSFPQIAVDPDGNLLMSSNFHAETQFGPFTLNGAAWVFDFFLVKMDTDGDYQWAREVPEVVTGDAGVGSMDFLDVDIYGNVYVAGVTRGTIDWGNGIISSTEFGYNYFIQCIDPSGEVQWVKTAEGEGYDAFQALEVAADGTVYTAGIGNDTVYFDDIVHYEEGFTYPLVSKVTQDLTGVTGLPAKSDHTTVYPNPAHDKIFVSGTHGDYEYEIYHLSGKLVRQSTGERSRPISIRELAPGYYFLKLNNSGRISVVTFVRR